VACPLVVSFVQAVPRFPVRPHFPILETAASSFPLILFLFYAHVSSDSFCIFSGPAFPKKGPFYGFSLALEEELNLFSSSWFTPKAPSPEFVPFPYRFQVRQSISFLF